MKKDKYDFIIVGAGIGGLVCAAYLAKFGKKVLVLEKNLVPGGLCTSFRRKGFVFDTGVHYLSSCRLGGSLGQMFSDLGIEIDFLKLNPSDSIIIGNTQVDFSRSVDATKSQLCDNFPTQSKNIVNFLNYLLALDINNKETVSHYVYDLRNLSFQDLLDRFFTDSLIKNIFYFFLFNLGLHPKEANALYSIYLIKEFIFDGGFYPKGGMSIFPEKLTKAFIDFGGKILFRNRVEKIEISNGRVISAKTNSGEFFANNFIVNSDVTQLFQNLIGFDLLPNKFLNNFRSLKCSRSLFLVHLALKEKIQAIPHCIWYSKNLDLDSVYDDLGRNKVNTSYIFAFFPSSVDPTLAPLGGESGYLAVITPYFKKEFWDNKKRNDIAEDMIRLAEDVYTDLSNKIEFTLTSTPDTFFRYTGNFQGAAYGWASSAGMESRENYQSFKTPFINLFICGHWATRGIGYGGIPMVVYSGIKMFEFLSKD